MVRKEAFACTRDGLTIRGHFFGDKVPGKQVVIISHGFLANEKTVYPYAEVLAAHDFPVVTYDFNGGGIECSSDGKSENMTVLTERDDLISVIRKVQEELTPQSITLMGCSQGGFVSAMTARQLGCDCIRRLVLFYPALCIPDDARRGEMLYYHFDPDHIPEMLGDKPMKLGGNYARTVIHMDSFSAIRGFGGRVLLIHGTEDKIVDISYARRARACYEACTYHEIEGAGHGFEGAAQQEAIDCLLNFMAGGNA